MALEAGLPVDGAAGVRLRRGERGLGRCERDLARPLHSRSVTARCRRCDRAVRIEDDVVGADDHATDTEFIGDRGGGRASRQRDVDQALRHDSVCGRP